MLRHERTYLFADPFNRPDSGVSSYVANAYSVLRRNSINAGVIARLTHETLSAYRIRLAEAVFEAQHVSGHVIVEAPESDAATTDIPIGTADIHIRLHCSRQLGAFVQGEPVCVKSLELEQKEINRATYLSAPSQSAVIASRTLFELPKNINCYPNPAPIWTDETQKTRPNKGKYIVFVGRFHALKGAHWIPELAARLTKSSFLLVGSIDQAHGQFTQPNIRILDGQYWSKPDIYRQAKLVIIPSIYETASMVGIEALTAGVPIITWSHLGIGEYAPAPMIKLVKPFQIDEFADAVRERALQPCLHPKMYQVSNNINRHFMRGLLATICCIQGHFMPVVLSAERAEKIPSIIREPMEVSSMQFRDFEPRWRRKLRKLRKEPVLYIMDSWVARLVFPPGDAGNTKEVLSMNQKSIIEQSESLKPFTNIDERKKIYFQEPPQKPVGLITAFLHSVDRSDDAQDIIEGFSAFSDFRYIQPPLLQIGTFQGPLDTHAKALIERIDLSNKKKISAIDHIILLDPPPILVETLRSCGTRQRTIVILDNNETVPPDPWHTDVLITIGSDHQATETQCWRRKIVVQDRKHLSLAIRRAIQESSPKTPDMFLPIMGFTGNHRELLMRLDAKYHQGIICSTPIKVSASATMNTIYTELVSNMTDIAVAESVYHRYRSLCDKIEDLEARAKFLSYSLYDGVVFDVRA